MGGRGTFAVGNNVPFKYKTVGKIDGVKIIQPIDSKKSLKRPEEAHSSSSYVLLDRDGVFHQHCEYDSRHRVVLEIGYHHEPSLGKGDILHVHIHKTPGVEFHSSAIKERIYPGHPIYEKYKNFFKGGVK